MRVMANTACYRPRHSSRGECFPELFFIPLGPCCLPCLFHVGPNERLYEICMYSYVFIVDSWNLEFVAYIAAFTRLHTGNIGRFHVSAYYYNIEMLQYCWKTASWRPHPGGSNEALVLPFDHVLPPSLPTLPAIITSRTTMRLYGPSYARLGIHLAYCSPTSIFRLPLLFENIVLFSRKTENFPQIHTLFRATQVIVLLHLVLVKESLFSLWNLTFVFFDFDTVKALVFIKVLYFFSYVFPSRPFDVCHLHLIS